MSLPRSPMCEEGILTLLNSGDIMSSPSVDDESLNLVNMNELQEPPTEIMEDDCSTSSDETWTPSIEGEDSDEEQDLDDTPGIWQEVPMRFQDFSISFNKVDSDLEFNYKEDVKDLKKRVLREFNSLSSENVKKSSTLNANQVMNAVYSSELLFSILGFQNKSLLERKKEPMDLKEY